MKIALILVHYHTPELLKSSVKAIRNDIGADNLEGEIIVIDNGSLPEDKSTLEALNVKLIDPGENLGYAGGVNLGVKNTDADHFILMNPDVRVEPHCIGSLISVLESGAGAAGPRFFLDENKQIALPPLMDMTPKNELIWRASALGDKWAKWARSKWRANAREHWNARTPIESYLLTGAMLAIKRSTWERIGPFDEEFKLYFEEADWLKRLEKSDLKAYYVPGAIAVHTYNQSAAKEPKAKMWFDESRVIFRKRYYGYLFNTFLDRIVPLLRRSLIGAGENQDSGSFSWTGLPLIDITIGGNIRSYPIWIEMSDNNMGIPAAAMPVEDQEQKIWRFPKEIWDNLEPGTYHFRTVDNAGNEIHHFTYAHYQSI